MTSMDTPPQNRTPKKLEILLVCDYRSNNARTITDHIFGIQKYSQHNVTVLKNFGSFPDELDLNRFDAVIIHYSITCCRDRYLSPSARLRLRAFKGLKAVFVQDEYRYINATIAALSAMKIDVLFSVVPQKHINEIYSPEKLSCRKVTVLTGYIAEDLLGHPLPLIKDRARDVGYRARKLPYWLGSLAKEKWEIAERFCAETEKSGLNVNMSCSEMDRLYGKTWISFLENSKAVLGTESGASVCDFTGDIQKKVDAYVARHPDASFEEVKRLFFSSEDGKHVIGVISPRIFEAIALKTLLILYEGDYSDRIKPWKHYVPLKKDYSNIQEVVSLLKNHERAQEIVDRAYNEVALNPENFFSAMVREVDEVLNSTIQPSMLASSPYNDGASLPSGKNVEQRKTFSRQLIYSIAIFTAALVFKFLQFLPLSVQRRAYLPLRRIWRNTFFPLVIKGEKSYCLLSPSFWKSGKLDISLYPMLFGLEKNYLGKLNEIKFLFTFIDDVKEASVGRVDALFDVSSGTLSFVPFLNKEIPETANRLNTQTMNDPYIFASFKNLVWDSSEMTGIWNLNRTIVEFPLLSSRLSRAGKTCVFRFILSLHQMGFIQNVFLVKDSRLHQSENKNG